jgi:hypothetical protein
MSDVLEPKKEQMEEILVSNTREEIEDANLPLGMMAELQAMVSKFHKDVEILTAKHGVTMKTQTHFELVSKT